MYQLININSVFCTCIIIVIIIIIEFIVSRTTLIIFQTHIRSINQDTVGTSKDKLIQTCPKLQLTQT